MAFDPTIAQIIKRCQKSPSFFIDNFCRVKHPKLGILPFKLFSYQKKCLKDFLGNRFNVFRKCRQCFAAGSMVWTPLGPKRIESIKPGDFIYSLNQLTGQLEVGAVGEVFANGISECVEVRTKTGHRSISTSDHKYLSHDGWIEANQLTINDRLVEVYEQPRYGNSPEHSSDPILLGYLLTDGGCNQKNFYFANSRWKYLLEFQKHYQLKFDRRLKIKKVKSGFKPDSDINYRITSAHADAQQWLGSYGLCGATGVNKKIPECVFQWNNEFIASLLNRMFAGDGWYSGSHCNEVGIGQQSIEVLHQIKQLLSRFQISSKIYENTDNSIPKLRIFGGKDFARFVEQIGIFGKEPRCDITKGFFFNRQKGEVKSVKPLEGGYKVYDLSVSPHHNYIVDGVVAHNCGISTLTGSFALWYAMFFNNKTVLIVSKRDDDAKEYLARNVKFAYLNLPEWMRGLWKPETINEHTLAFSNGSSIKSLTSSPDTLRSNASSLNIIDEAAFIDKMEDMWSGGWSCVKPTTIIPCNGSLSQIGDLGDIEGDEWQDVDIDVQSDRGVKKSDKFYVNGVADTNIVTTSLGYEIECTDNHRLKDENYDWIYSRDVKIDQKLALKGSSDFDVDFDTYLIGDVNHYQDFRRAKNKDIVSALCNHCGKFDSLNYRTYKRNWNRNSNRFICRRCGPMLRMSPDFNKPKILDEGLSEVVGYFVGDGSLETGRRSRLRLCYDPQDQDIYDHFASYFEGLGLNPLQRDSNGAQELRINNSRFAEWFIRNGLKSKNNAHDAEVPSVILKSSVRIRAAFLRGYFEADGWFYNCKHVNRPLSGQWKQGCSSVSEKLIKQIQLMLLDFGVVSRRFKSKGGFENSGPSWRLEVINMDQMVRFMRLIGFISSRKNLPIIKLTKMKPTKYIVDDDGIFYDTVVSKVRSRSMTVDISVPVNNTYVANGFISHNTLQHGGSVIVVSTPRGVGNWYWKVWTGAVDKQNDFNPIIINWWDMDWELKFQDELSGVKTIIAPTKKIKTLTDPRKIEKYGPGPDGETFWSPWLEGEYRNLATKGDDSKFRQEVLAEFIGSGDTVLSRIALSVVDQMTNDDYVAIGTVDYINPAINDHLVLDFQDQLWVWEKPYTKEDAAKATSAAKLKGIDPRSLPSEITCPHVYVIGADTSTGEADDYSAIQVIDIMTQRQVAELKIKVLPKQFARMVDYVGRMYNNAHVVCERTGIGQAVTQELDKDLMYPNLYRHSKVTSTLKVKYNQIGYPTSHSTKPVLVKHLVDNIGVDGWEIRSTRLYHECCIYIHLGNGKYGNEPGVGNTDDLIISLMLALAGIQSALMRSNIGLMPINNITAGSSQMPAVVAGKGSSQFDKLKSKGLMVPMGSSSEMYTNKVSQADELTKFTLQVGQGITLDKNTKKPLLGPGPVTKKKHILKYFRG